MHGGGTFAKADRFVGAAAELQLPADADFAMKKRDGYADSDILMTKELLDRDGWNATAVDQLPETPA